MKDDHTGAPRKPDQGGVPRTMATDLSREVEDRSAGGRGTLSGWMCLRYSRCGVADSCATRRSVMPRRRRVVRLFRRAARRCDWRRATPSRAQWRPAHSHGQGEAMGSAEAVGRTALAHQ